MHACIHCESILHVSTKGKKSALALGVLRIESPGHLVRRRQRSALPCLGTHCQRKFGLFLQIGLLILELGCH